jgi:hypothetical protein
MMDPAQMKEEVEGLNTLIPPFGRDFAKLENTLAALLHEALFCKTKDETRIAYAIYFSPDSFGIRQSIVNNAVREWLIENPMAQLDFLALWARINDRLYSIRGARNVVAHGSVNLIDVRGARYVRLMTPAYSPKLEDAAAKGTIPGLSLKEMRRICGALSDVLPCIANMVRVLQYHDEDEETWRGTYDALVENLSQLDTWFPAAPKPQGCSGQPQSSGE